MKKLIRKVRMALVRRAADRRSIKLRNDKEVLQLLEEQVGDVWFYKEAVKLEVDGLCISDHCCGLPMVLVRSWRQHLTRPGELANWHPFAVCIDKKCNHVNMIADLSS